MLCLSKLGSPGFDHAKGLDGDEDCKSYELCKKGKLQHAERRA